MTRKSKYPILNSLLFTLNLLVLIPLIFSLLSGFVPPTVIPFFSVFGLLYPPLYFANLFFVLIWILVKPKYALASIIVILFGFSNLTDHFQLSLSKTTNGQANHINLLSYNVQRFGLDVSEEESSKTRRNVLQFLVEEQADIICLQEYHGKGKTLYEPLQEMKTRLNAISYYYESYYNPRYQQLTGLVIFSKFEAINKGKLKFDGSRTFGIFTDVRMDTDTIRIYNIHLASIQLMHSDIDFVVNPGQDQEKMGIHALKIYSKLSEAFQLREQQMGFLMKEIGRCPFPIILSGDFNDTPSSYVYGKISDKLEDTFVERGKGFSITYAGRIPFLRIDYVMKSDDFSTLSYRRYKVDFSDHYPVSAMLTRF